MFKNFVCFVIIVIIQGITVNADCHNEYLDRLSCQCKNSNKELACFGTQKSFTSSSPEWDHFKSDKSIIELGFSQNFDYLPFHLFPSLENLELFKMWRLKVTTIPSNAFKNLKNLREIFIYNNDLTTVQKHAFVNLPSLKELSLYWNQISSIEVDSLSEVPNLEVLNLSWNQIRQIPKGFFDNLLNLKKLYFEYNPIKHLDLRVMAPILSNFINKDSALMLYGKEYICSCELMWIAYLNKNTKNENIKQHINEFVCTDGINSMKIMDYSVVAYCPNLSTPQIHIRRMTNTNTKTNPNIKDMQITGETLDEKNLDKLKAMFHVHTINISNSTIINN